MVHIDVHIEHPLVIFQQFQNSQNNVVDVAKARCLQKRTLETRLLITSSQMVSASKLQRGLAAACTRRPLAGNECKFTELEPGKARFMLRLPTETDQTSCLIGRSMQTAEQN